ncbi:MAG: ERCC4 domain-containing protein [Paraclostridium sp.]
MDIKDCKVKMIVDSREQKWDWIKEEWEKNNIDYHIFKKENSMKVGDYSIAIQLEDGEVIDFRDKVCVERKANLTELCNNFTEDRDSNGNCRIVREFIRAKENNIKLLLLIEDAEGYNKALNGFFREDKPSRMNKKAFMGMLFAYKARYNFEIVWLDKKDSASYIYNYLYYEAREYLKNMKMVEV